MQSLNTPQLKKKSMITRKSLPNSLTPRALEWKVNGKSYKGYACLKILESVYLVSSVFQPVTDIGTQIYL